MLHMSRSRKLTHYYLVRDVANVYNIYTAPRSPRCKKVVILDGKDTWAYRLVNGVLLIGDEGAATYGHLVQDSADDRSRIFCVHRADEW